MKILGKVIALTPIRAGKFTDGSTFTRRTIAVEEIGNEFPQSVAADLYNERCELHDIQVGSFVSMSYNIKVRRSVDKQTGDERLFNSCRAWSVELK